MAAGQNPKQEPKWIWDVDPKWEINISLQKRSGAEGRCRTFLTIMVHLGWQAFSGKTHRRRTFWTMPENILDHGGAPRLGNFLWQNMTVGPRRRTPPQVPPGVKGFRPAAIYISLFELVDVA